MTFSSDCRLTLQVTVTPGQVLASNSFKLGFENVSMSINSTANQVFTRRVTVTTSSKSLEPDTNTYDGAAEKDANGATVDVDTLYLAAFYNRHATNPVTITCDSTLGSAVFVVPAESYVVLHSKGGYTLSSSSTFGMQSTGGSADVDVVVIGKSNS